MDIKPKHIHILFYLGLVATMVISGCIQYQRWLNPLGMKPEENPKQHDGSQEFTPPRDFESVIKPLPAEEGGATIYVTPEQLEKYSNEEEPKQVEEPVEQEDIIAVPQTLELE